LNTARPVIILDLDNCIANDEWRIPFIDWNNQNRDERYHVYHALGGYDGAPDLDWLFAFLAGHSLKLETEFRVFVLTARALRYRRATEWWLKEHLPWPVEGLLMRNTGDNRHSAPLKRSQLQTLLELHDVAPEDILFAADDRQEVLDAYRSVADIPTMRYAIHDTDAYNDPRSAIRTPPEILRAAAATFEERNKTYGQNYKQVGPTMMALFPNGVELRTANDFTRWHMFELLVVKMTPFANSNLVHEDSIHDAGVYAAMIQSFNSEINK